MRRKILNTLRAIKHDVVGRKFLSDNDCEVKIREEFVLIGEWVPEEIIIVRNDSNIILSIMVKGTSIGTVTV